MEKKWVTVCQSVTNTTPDSYVTIDINTQPICPNLTNAQFRALIMKLRDIAVKMIDDRYIALARYWTGEQERVKTWFGKADDETRQVLLRGLPKLKTAMLELRTENMIRYDDEKGKTLTCTPVTDSGLNDASVCKPDSSKRLIYFYSHFCTLPAADLKTICKLKVIIHECSHYVDTFDSLDNAYGYASGLKYYAMRKPEEALANADSIACYIAHFEDGDLGSDLELCKS